MPSGSSATPDLRCGARTRSTTAVPELAAVERPDHRLLRLAGGDDRRRRRRPLPARVRARHPHRESVPEVARPDRVGRSGRRVAPWTGQGGVVHAGGDVRVGDDLHPVAQPLVPEARRRARGLVGLGARSCRESVTSSVDQTSSGPGHRRLRAVGGIDRRVREDHRPALLRGRAARNQRHQLDARGALVGQRDPTRRRVVAACRGRIDPQRIGDRGALSQRRQDDPAGLVGPDVELLGTGLIRIRRMAPAVERREVGDPVAARISPSPEDSSVDQSAVAQDRQRRGVRDPVAREVERLDLRGIDLADQRRRVDDPISLSGSGSSGSEAAAAGWRH